MSIKKFIPHQPDPYILGDEANMTPVKFGHLNAIVNEINKTSASNGTFQFPQLAADPTTNLQDGQAYYNTTTDVVRLRANGAWVNL